MSPTRNNIRELTKRVVAVQEQARSLGLFPGDRELLECPKCGLLEDVLMGGKLITYHAGAEGQDTGLRFKELAEGKFSCPACGGIVKER
ncbi:MAG: hypothetical protein AABO57_03085 [Acidobacteriota bacterium]